MRNLILWLMILSQAAFAADVTPKFQSVINSPDGTVKADVTNVAAKNRLAVEGPVSVPGNVNVTQGTTPWATNQGARIFTILDDVTLTADGATGVLPDDQGDTSELNVIVKITGPVSGTLPTLQFRVYDMAPDGSLTGNISDSQVFTTPTTTQIFTHSTKTSHVQLNWMITGAIPQFEHVSVWFSFISSPNRLRDAEGAAITNGQKTMVDSVPVTVASDQSPIPISGTVTIPPGLATEATLSSLNAKFNSLGQKLMAASAPVVLASDQSAIPVTQSGTWDINNISGTVSLPTGAATQATLAALNAKINSLGQKLMAASTPVVIASDQSAIPASQSGTWNINNISGTVSLPTGASTEVTLSAINAKLNSLGQKLMAASVPVVIASDQSAVPASQSGTWNINNVSGTISLPTGAATAANQTTEITSLQIIDDLPLSIASTTSGQKGVLAQGAVTTAAPSYTTSQTDPLSLTTSGALRSDLQSVGGSNITLGQKTMANSLPVVLSSDQNTINVVSSAASLATYFAAANFTVAALVPTDFFTIAGSGTKTIKVRRIKISGVNTGNTNALINVIKRSVADTGGTSTVVTNVSADSTDSAATATVRSYTANPTLGTGVGTIDTRYLFFPGLASTNPAKTEDFVFGTANDKAVTLRGTAEQLVLNFNGVTLGGTSTVSVMVEWTEE